MPFADRTTMLDILKIFEWPTAEANVHEVYEHYGYKPSVMQKSIQALIARGYVERSGIAWPGYMLTDKGAWFLNKLKEDHQRANAKAMNRSSGSGEVFNRRPAEGHINKAFN
jgi:predicted transcriptional regulator